MACPSFGHLGRQLGPKAVGQGLLLMPPSWEVGLNLRPPPGPWELRLV